MELLSEQLGYQYIGGPDVVRDYHNPLYEEAMFNSLTKVNKGLPVDAINDAIYKLKNFENGSIVQKNAVFMDYLQNGVPVKYFIKGEERSSLVYLIDFENVNNNSFYTINNGHI